MSSNFHATKYLAKQCIDGRVSSFCQTKLAKAPWLALDFGVQVSVKTIVIHNRDNGNRFRNVKVWVADPIPRSEQEKFSGGHHVASFTGLAETGDVITLPSSTELGGRFVIIQIDNTPGTRGLHLNEVTVLGKKGKA